LRINPSTRILINNAAANIVMLRWYVEISIQKAKKYRRFKSPVIRFTVKDETKAFATFLTNKMHITAASTRTARTSKGISIDEVIMGPTRSINKIPNNKDTP
jgi:hypothetical protein